MLALCLISTLPDASSMTQTNATVKFAIAAIPTTKTKSCIIRVLKTSIFKYEVLEKNSYFLLNFLIFIENFVITLYLSRVPQM